MKISNKWGTVSLPLFSFWCQNYERKLLLLRCLFAEQVAISKLERETLS